VGAILGGRFSKVGSKLPLFGTVIVHVVGITQIDLQALAFVMRTTVGEPSARFAHSTSPSWRDLQDVQPARRHRRNHRDGIGVQLLRRCPGWMMSSLGMCMAIKLTTLCKYSVFHFGVNISAPRSRIQISADSDNCSGKVDLGFSAAGRKSKSPVGRFF
jgi:hypothetical protein